MTGCRDDVRSSPSPELPSPASIKSVVVEVWDEAHAVIETKRTTDRRVIESLLTVLGGGQAVSPHKCAAWGRILLHTEGGGVVELQILPGHHPDRYEFRRAAFPFSVPRKAFAEVLRSVGVTHLPGVAP